MVQRLDAAPVHVTLWNRTPSRATALASDHVTVAPSLDEVAAQGLVFSSLATSADVEEVAERLLAASVPPRVLVDTSTISVKSTQRVQRLLGDKDIAFLCSPVSGNPGAIAAGTASFVCSGDEGAFREARPYLETIGVRATYLGTAAEATIVKLGHNLLLAIVTQGLAEVVTLCRQRGVDAAPLMDFLNNSVLGSTFTQYKTPAIVDHDLTVTFTTELLLKDVGLGLDEGRATGTPLPLAALVRESLVSAIAQGHAEADFLSLFAVQAAAAGINFDIKGR